MNYATFKTTLETFLVINDSDEEWPLVLPAIIEDGELLCYREVDFMATRKYEDSNFGATAPLNAILGGPSDLVLIRNLYYFTPYPLGPLTGGVRHELDRRDETFINDYWPNRSTTGVPKFFAELGYGQILIAPSPPAQYAVQMAMTYRPTTLSSTNTSTWLSTWCPDLLLYACLIIACGYQRNFGAAADLPGMAVSWGQAYEKAKAAAKDEEARRKSQGLFDHGPTPPPSGNAPTGE